MGAVAEVAVHLPVQGTYHYSIPDRLRDRDLVGHRALVPFGNRGVTGVVVATSDEPPEAAGRIKAIEGLLDPGPLLTPEVLELCQWISGYYEAPLGEVIRAAMPAGSTVTASQKVQLSEAGALALDEGRLEPGMRSVAVALRDLGGAAVRKDLAKRCKRSDIAQAVEEGWAAFALSAGKARVRDRKTRTAQLAMPAEEARAKTARAPAQRVIVEALVDAAGAVDIEALKKSHARAADLIRQLAKAGVVETAERTLRRASEIAELTGVSSSAVPLALNASQQTALDAISLPLSEGRFAGLLLHGITGSGKTEVYLQAIAVARGRGKGALVLVPEISLTPQLSARFRARFGDEVAVLHSGLSDRERYDEWHRIRAGEARIAVGARSAIFAPVIDLGIIVVDEEHDSSFKQEEGLRYHARDVALVRSRNLGAVCLLGSATPSLESYHGTESGRLTRLELPKRATGRDLPEVELVDLRRYKPDRESMLTAPLVEAITETLQQKSQAILFLNRRGFDTFVVCVGCGHAFRCTSCSVSLTYHRYRDAMVCHYCGHTEALATSCPSCHADAISRRGVGTEKIASAVAERFPDARIERLDRDVATGPQVQRILGRVARHEVDILVGTQMVTKGHDFPGVTLVGVLLADTGLSLPDFRASERTFQLLTQVAGRAGRAELSGRVLVQSYRVDALAVSAAAKHDYAEFYRGEMAVRSELGYPPFGHLVALRIDGPDSGAVVRQARSLSDAARRVGPAAGVVILGPSEAPLGRLKGRTRWHLWLRARERKPLRQALRQTLDAARTVSGVRVTVDVDPLSSL